MAIHIPTEAALAASEITGKPVPCPTCPYDDKNDLRYELCPNTGDCCLDCCGEEHFMSTQNPTRERWSVSPNGYIFSDRNDTPLFTKAQDKHNTRIELRLWRKGAAKPFKAVISSFKNRKGQS